MHHITAENSTISGPLRLTSYYVVAPYNDPKTRFNLLLGATVQVMQKEPTGEFASMVIGGHYSDVDVVTNDGWMW